MGAAVAHYDLVLRLGWRAMPTAIRHIPAVLCHRSTLSQATWNAKAARGVVRRLQRELLALLPAAQLARVEQTLRVEALLRRHHLGADDALLAQGTRTKI